MTQTLHYRLIFLFVCGTTLDHVNGLNMRNSMDSIPRMISDFVQFYRYGSVCIFRQQSGGNNSWVFRTFHRLMRFTPIYSEVVQVAPNMVHLQNCHGLIVYRLEREADAYHFKSVFPLTPVHSSWLLLMPQQNISRWLKHCYLPLNSKVIILTKPDEDPEMNATLWEAYQITPNTDLIVRPVGIWWSSSMVQGGESTKSVIWNEKDFVGSSVQVQRRQLHYGEMEAVVGDLIDHRTDLQGLNLKCTCLKSGVRLMYKHLKDGTVELDGILGDLVKYLQQYANFSLTCSPPPDNEWGSVSNGQWTGMVKELLTGSADIAVASLDMTYQRSQVIDFLQPIFRTNYKIVLRRPSKNDDGMTLYTRQFPPSVWILIGMVLVASIMLLWMSSFFCMDDGKLRLQDTFYIVAGALCGQSTETTMRCTHGRLLVFTVMVLHVVLLAHYTSDLVSSLTAGPSLPTSMTMMDIYNNPDLTFGFVRGMAASEYLKNSTNYEYQTIGFSLQDQDMVGSRGEGMERVLKDNYAYLVASHYFYTLFSKDCRYFMLPTGYFSSPGSIAIKKGSPLVPLFNRILLKMRTAGLLDRWHNSWTPSPGVCEKLEIQQISLNATITPFLVLFSACILAFVLCVLECLLYRFRSRRCSVIPPRVLS